MTETTPIGPPRGEPPASRLGWLEARPALLALLLAAAVVMVFSPALRCQFINLDDPLYVTSNPPVQGGLSAKGLAWAFRSWHASNWHPVTWLSHELDCQLYGLKPAGHHLTSVLLHAANAALLFLLLRQLTGAVWRSALVAALFALHPLRVESVAWVSERKDVLSGFFFMLTLAAYAKYAEESRVLSLKSKVEGQSPRSTLDVPRGESTAKAGRREEERKRFASSRLRCSLLWESSTLHAPRFYVLALLFFALGLMSKPMLVTMPFVLLLLDYWPLRRFGLRTQDLRLKTVFAEKAPFLLLSLGSCLLTLRVQQAGGAVETLERLPAGSRVANALVSYCAYLGEIVWPRALAVFYPHVPIPAWQAGGAALLLAAVSVLCVRQARARPWWLVGWMWFCVMLLPVIGLVQVGWQARADRYTYLPSIGIFIMVVWGMTARGLNELNELNKLNRLHGLHGLNKVCPGSIAPYSLNPFNLCNLFNSFNSPNPVNAAIAMLLLALCVIGTTAQLRHWRDSESLFRHALAVTTGNWLAHHNLATLLAEEGKAEEAAAQFQATLQINPGCYDARSNLGRLLAEHGKPGEGKEQLEALLDRNPRNAGAHKNLGSVLLSEGKGAEGIAQYALARQLQPEDLMIPEDLAAALAKPAAVELAPPQLRQALDLLPTAEMRAQVASALAEQERFQSAIQAYRAALALQPQSPGLLNNLAWLLATCPAAETRDGAEAVGLAERACELTGHQQTLMVGTLAAAYAEAGRFADAVVTAQRACALAAASDDQALAARNQQLLQLYRAGQPYRVSLDRSAR